MDEVRYYYFTVNSETGNKQIDYLCFFHAMMLVLRHGERYIKSEVIDKDEFWTCDECKKESQ